MAKDKRGIWPTATPTREPVKNVTCGYVTHRKFGNNPEEYCDEESVPGTDRCETHS